MLHGKTNCYNKLVQHAYYLQLMKVILYTAFLQHSISKLKCSNALLDGLKLREVSKYVISYISMDRDKDPFIYIAKIF